MKSVFTLINLNELMAATQGSPKIVIGIIDGSVDASHPDLQSANIKVIPGNAISRCISAGSQACRHGTFVASILSSSRGGTVPGICPGCTLLVRPIFCEAYSVQACPTVTPQDLATAIFETIDAGARVINLSLGLGSNEIKDYPDLREALDYALKKGVLVVTAAGNQGRVGHTPMVQHQWIIPVAACDSYGMIYSRSNIGTIIGKLGVMAPGVLVSGAASGGGTANMSGTSVAVPFVTGTIALLWSLFPSASAEQIRRAILLDRTRKSAIPPLLDAMTSWQFLKTIV